MKVCIDPHPNVDTGIFRIEATDDVFRLLVDAHETEFTIPELVDATNVARSTVWRAVDFLRQGFGDKGVASGEMFLLEDAAFTKQSLGI